MADDEKTRTAKAQVDPEEVGSEAAEADAADPGLDVEVLREQLAVAEDRALRVQAEAQNMIRRAERDIENARKYALERFVGLLLPVLDNLDRSLQAMGEPSEANKPVYEGIHLTHRNFVDVLQKVDVAEVDPAGELFDPEKHQAMSMVEAGDTAPNTVVAVMQKGYTLNGRLLRPALVIVAKPAAARIDESA